MNTNRIISSKYDVNGIAEEIVSVLPQGVTRAVSDDRQSIRFVVRAAGLKLRSVVFNRASLQRLIDDPARDIKIEYLQRELEGVAARRAEFRYPRASRIAAAQTAARRLRLAFATPVACVL